MMRKLLALCVLVLACGDNAAAPAATAQLKLVSPPDKAVVGENRTIEVLISNTGTEPLGFQGGCNALRIETLHNRQFDALGSTVCMAIHGPLWVPPGTTVSLRAPWPVGYYIDTKGEQHLLPAGRYLVRAGLSTFDNRSAYSAPHAVEISPAPSP